MFVCVENIEVAIEYTWMECPALNLPILTWVEGGTVRVKVARNSF